MSSRRDEKGRFQREYMNSEVEFRDRFQVELGKEEREMFTNMQIAFQQSKDATAMKLWAFYGWLAFSNIGKANSYFREKLLINERNNKRLGINVEVELENKFHQNIQKMLDMRGEK